MKIINRLLISLVFFASSVTANQHILNIYIWSNYLPQNVVKQFEQQTGIKVNISEYDSNETMYAKLKASPNIGYDVIIPSSYYVERMAREGMLHKIEKSKLPNMRYLNKDLLNKDFDRGNYFSIPYLWGTTGIVINSQYFTAKQITKWSDLWNKDLKDQLLILNDMREGFSIALITLGYSINDTNPKHIKQAYEKLKELMPNIKIFNSDAEQSMYIDEDAVIGMGWNGDIYNAKKENANLNFILPEDGFPLWIDCAAITKKAPNLNNAYKFLNFIMQPEIAKDISMQVGYSSPNEAAMKLLPAVMRDDPIINPGKTTLKRAQFQGDLGSANQIYANYWQLLKISG